jgi:hypothetical protein
MRSGRGDEEVLSRNQWRGGLMKLMAKNTEEAQERALKRLE